jgi:hypothetical protein
MAGGDLAGAEPYLQGKPCPKCAYVRTAADTNPAWQCPKCLIAYLKYRPGGQPLRARLVAGGRELATEAKSDRSLFALIAANLLALLIAWRTDIDLRELLLVYWMQSVIIGVCSVIRILCLDRFSTENFRIGKQTYTEDPGTKYEVAGLFVLHYGLFHLFFLFWLSIGREPRSGGAVLGFLLCTIVFAVNHGYSLAQNVKRDALGKPNLGTLMNLPYARVVPMHIIGILAVGPFAGGAQPLFPLFGALKILADCLMHTVEHHVLAKGSVLPPPDRRT